MIKDEFYSELDYWRDKDKTSMKTIHKLLEVIKFHSNEKELSEIVSELREINDCCDVMDEIDEVIEWLIENTDICPVCGNKMEYEKEVELHQELSMDDPNRIQYYTYLKCSECQFEDR